MKLTIHDVGHGICISLIHQNGNTMLWDCGHQNSVRPSEFLPKMGVKRIDRLFVTNYDQDHLSDLPALRKNLPIPTLNRNKSISADQLRTLKLQGGPLSDAMGSMLDMIATYTAGPPNPPPSFPGVTFETFKNSYGAEFDDTNNISLVTFLSCNGENFVFPGDLEQKGWKGLLSHTGFTEKLSDVNVFVASHHGRESGYSKEVLNIASPNVVVFSDSPIRYATQAMANTYGEHCSGVEYKGEQRKVLSTRNDGPLTWQL